MTSKLKCPVCGGELEEALPIVKVLGCPKCKLFGCIELYERLEQSQKDLEESQQATLENAQTILEIHKDLETARKALEDIKSDYELYSEQGCRMEPNETDMYNYARAALEQIEHKE